MKTSLIILFFIFPAGLLHAQIQGVVVEKKTRYPIPFASVSYEINSRQKGIIADKQGEFSLSESPVRQINFSCLGYKSRTVSLDKDTSFPLIIELEEQDFLINELVVTPQENPALRIIRKVTENKDRNNYENYDDYSYRCYFKTVWDIQSATGTETDSVTGKKPDDAMLISETVSLCNKSGGRPLEEKIIATRTSGMKTPTFGHLTYMFFYKAISFYKHSVQIFGEIESENKMQTDYLSPLCNNCFGAYHFQLEQSFVNENDTIFEITYFPKKNKNFNALMGTMFISSNGYAIASIVARPFEPGLIDFKFKQEYKYLNGKWFPENMEEEIGFRQLRLGKNRQAYPAFFVTSKIDSVSLSPPEKGTPYHLDKVFIDEKSIARSHSIIEDVRPLPLSERESKTYHDTDSLLAKFPMDAIINSLTKIDEAKITVNKLDVDLARIYSFNRYEGSRYGLGLYTNEYLIKFLSIGGYVGYGWNDKKTKYGGNLEFTLNRSHDLKIKYSYQNSLKEIGRDLPDAVDFVNNFHRNIMAYRFDRCIENKLEGSYAVSRSLILKTSFNLRNLKPMYDYFYRSQPLSDYIADEMKVSLHYAPGAHYTTFGYHRTPLYRGNPIFNITYARGTHWLRTTGLTYNKWEASMELLAYNGQIGQSNLRLEGGCIDRDLPPGLLFTGEGSKDELFSLLVGRTFQTMQPYEFLSDKYARMFYSHNFGALLFKTKLFSPEFLAAYNAGWGNLSCPSDHEPDFRIQNHIYQEAGLIIDNILKINYLNMVYLRLGFGGFWRCGYYRQDKPSDNLALKMVLSVSFK